MRKRHPLVPEVDLPVPAFPPLLARIRAMEKDSTLSHLSPFEDYEDSWARHWYPRIGAAWQRLRSRLDPDEGPALGSVDVLFLQELRPEIHEWCLDQVRPEMLSSALERLAEEGHYVLNRCEWMDGLCIDGYGPAGRPSTDQILEEFASRAARLKYLETELAASLDQRARQIYPDLPWLTEANTQNW